MIQNMAAIIAATVAGLSALSAAFWWVYRRGKATGRAEATLQALAHTSATVEELADRVARVEAERNRHGFLRRVRA